MDWTEFMTGIPQTMEVGSLWAPRGDHPQMGRDNKVLLGFEYNQEINDYDDYWARKGEYILLTMVGDPDDNDVVELSFLHKEKVQEGWVYCVADWQEKFVRVR